MTVKMKSTALLVALVSAVSLSALTANAQSTVAVYSANIIGIQKASVPTNLSVKGNPFQPMLLRNVAGTKGKFTTTSDITLADNVMFFNPITQTYDIWYLRSAGGVGPEWRLGSQWATNTYATAGKGFFYRNRGPAVMTNVVVGDVVLAKAVTNTIYPGLNLIAYPFSTSKKMSEMNLKNGKYTTSSDVSLADNLMIFNPVTQAYDIWYLRSAGGIGPEWRLGSQWGTNIVIDTGVGFWFRSRLPNPYQWIENTPYPNL